MMLNLVQLFSQALVLASLFVSLGYAQRKLLSVAKLIDV